MESSRINKKDLIIILLLIFNIAFSVGIYRSFLSQMIDQNSQISALKENYLELEKGLSEIRVRFEGPNEIYRLIKPSVVEVKAANHRWGMPLTGSGFVYDSEGHIITNAHVIEGSSSIQITFSDGTVSEASLIGVDVYSDLAVIKVDMPKNTLKPAILGNSSRLNIGDPVLAVGNPYGLSGSMTSGIVSQLDRIFPAEGGYSIVGMIQVDAAVNPGNSGGPLLNYLGEVVGVNTVIVSRIGEFTGVGFAVPSNLVRKVVPSLIVEGVYRHPWLGITGVEVTPEIAEIMNLDQTYGVLITFIVEGSPAEKSGLLAGEEKVSLEGYEFNIGGDIIIGINGHPVKRMNDLLIYLEYNTLPGEEVSLDIIRNGEYLSLEVKLGERPLP